MGFERPAAVPHVVIQQVDLDTCLTGVLLGLRGDEVLVVRRDGATSGRVGRRQESLCIEAGGSGQTDRGNFDHHDRGGSWPPACVQALQTLSGPVDQNIRRLVDHVAAVDLGIGRRREPDGALTLSGLFSGMTAVGS